MKKKTNEPKYSQEIFDEICKKIAISSHGLEKILKSDVRYPAVSSFYEWIYHDNILFDQYFKAKVFQVNILSDEIVKISDDRSQDTIIDDNGNERCDKEWVQRSRLRVDTRKWLCSKLAPRIYGDKLQLAEPISQAITENNYDLSKLSTHELKQFQEIFSKCQVSRDTD